MGIKLLLILIVMMSIGIADASITESLHKDVTLFGGSSYEYFRNDNNTHFIIFRDTSGNSIADLNKRWVEFWILKNGNLIDKGICYNRDYCYIRDVKINLRTVFYGREATAIKFDILVMP